MSPNLFQRAPRRSGRRGDELIAAESTSWCSSSTFGNSSECTRRDHLAPEPAGLEHVHLVDAGHARARRAERDPGDPPISAPVVAEVGRVGLGARLLAEVDPAGELAHDEQVGALDQLALERAGVVERRHGRTGRRFAYSPSSLRSAEQTLLGPRRGGVGRVPLGPPTAASSTASAARHAAVVASVSGTPWASIEAPPNGAPRSRIADRVEDARCGSEDLGPDAVARERDDVCVAMRPVTLPAARPRYGSDGWIVGSPATTHTSRLTAGTKDRSPPGSRESGTLSPDGLWMM